MLLVVVDSGFDVVVGLGLEVRARVGAEVWLGLAGVDGLEVEDVQPIEMCLF